MLNKKKHGEGLKILTPKHMIQRLPIVLAQAKAGNISDWKFTKWNQTNNIFFISSKGNY